MFIIIVSTSDAPTLRYHFAPKSASSPTNTCIWDNIASKYDSPPVKYDGLPFMISVRKPVFTNIAMDSFSVNESTFSVRLDGPSKSTNEL